MGWGRIIRILSEKSEGSEQTILQSWCVPTFDVASAGVEQGNISRVGVSSREPQRAPELWSVSTLKSGGVESSRKEDIVLGAGKLVVSVMLGFGRAGFVPDSHLDSWYDLGQSLQTSISVTYMWLCGHLRGDLESQLIQLRKPTLSWKPLKNSYLLLTALKYTYMLNISTGLTSYLFVPHLWMGDNLLLLSSHACQVHAGK